MKRTILITGGAGFIGSHTCVEMLNSGYDVVVVDNLDNSSSESLDRVEKITGKKIIHTIQDAEPIGPKQMTDIMIVAPCSRKHYVKTCL